MTHTVSGGDYAAITAQDVAVTVTDNDTPGVTVAPTSLTVGEGDMGTYTVKLNTLPIRQRDGRHQLEQCGRDRIPVQPDVHGGQLEHSTQTVTVSAGQDADAADDMATLTHNPSGADYGSVGNADLAVTVTDNDTRGVTVTPTSLTVTEGGMNTYTVVLDTQPYGHRDGHHRRSDRQRGRDGKPREPDVHDHELGARRRRSRFRRPRTATPWRTRPR